ncbi:MAG: hypothetical protein ACKOBD_17580, partial [Chloroflexota bacterium]
SSNAGDMPPTGMVSFDWTDHPEASGYEMTLVTPNSSPALEDEVGEVHSMGQSAFACDFSCCFSCFSCFSGALMILADCVVTFSPHPHALLIIATTAQNTGDFINFL